MASSSGGAVFAVDGGIWLSHGAALFDGGVEEGFEPTGPLSRLAIGQHNACLQRPSGDVQCWGPGLPLQTLLGADAGIVSLSAIGGVAADGTLYDWELWYLARDVPPRQIQARAIASDFGFDRVTTECVLLQDGGLSNVPLPEAASVISGACAALPSGVWCWDPYMYSSPRKISGVVTGVRQLVGSAVSGCALSGSNAVACWGTNSGGELGREGGGSMSAVYVPMPEPVKSIGNLSNHAAVFSALPDLYCALLASGRVQCWGTRVGPTAMPVEVQ
jgi:hypothetical protein